MRVQLLPLVGYPDSPQDSNSRDSVGRRDFLIAHAKG